MKVYFDTNIISGVVNGDLKLENAEAMAKIASLGSNGSLTLCGSTIAKDEIDEIPAPWRSQHLEEYRKLEIVRASTSVWIDENAPASSDFDRDYQGLRSVLPHENDAKHLALAKLNGISVFITADEASILNHAPILMSDFGLKVVSPYQFVCTWSST